MTAAQTPGWTEGMTDRRKVMLANRRVEQRSRVSRAPYHIGRSKPYVNSVIISRWPLAELRATAGWSAKARAALAAAGAT